MPRQRSPLDRTLRPAILSALPAALICAALLAVTLPRATSATPITSAANAVQSGISPGGVDMATGEIIVVCRPDLALDGPMPVNFQRYYASMLAREGLASSRMGPNWLGTYDWKLNVSGLTADVITNLGRDVKFQMPPAGGPWMLVSPLDQAYVLSFSGGLYRFTDPVARRVYLFSGSPPMLAQIFDEHGNSLTLSYAGNQLVQVSDGLGRTLMFGYDAFSGLLTSVGDGARGVSYSYTGTTLTGFTDAGGATWTYAYVSPSPIQGLLTGAGEPAGNTPMQNSYDALGRVVMQTDAAGGVAHYAWDAPGGNLFIDPLGRAWTYLHDAQNRLVSLTDPNSQFWSRAYDAAGRLTSETRPLGDMTTFGYDATSGYPAMAGFADGSAMHWTYGSHTMGGGSFFDLASIQFPDLATEMFTRDGAGDPIMITDRGGFHWQATFNTRGQTLTGTNPAGGVTTFTYDTGGLPISTMDPAGNVTRFTYDALSRLIALAPDDTSSRSWGYDALDHVLSAVDERGKTRTYQYDANGRLTGATDPLLQTTHYAYDGLDRVLQVTDPLGNATMFAYDARGLVASITDGTSRTTNYSYNVWGDFAGMTEAASPSWTYDRDANRRVTSAQDPLGASVSYSYDAVDRLTHLTDPVGTGFDYGYDAMDRLHSESGPLGFLHTYGYDARGLMMSAMNVTSEYDYERNSLGGISQFTDPNRKASLYGYDSQGRLATAADPLGRSSSYSYDARGRLNHATLPVNSASLTYDRTDRLLGVSITDGTSLAYNYDDANRVIGGSGAAFTYDAGGRMTSSNGLSFAYDDAGRLTSESYGPGKVVSYSYDTRGQLSQMTDWMGGVTTFSYDLAGNYTGTTRPNGTTGAYAYDAAGHLVNAVEQEPGPTNLSSLTITRDALEQPTAVERAAPLLPAVQAPGTTNLSYDAASQVAGLTWDGLGRLMGDGSRTLVWDGASRLSSYTAPGEAQSFSYDAFGRLRSRTQGAASEQYEWNYTNGSPTLDVVMNGPAPVRYFIHTPSGRLLESIEDAGGARRYYHYDENGNTIFLTDDTGAVVAEYAYGPFGDVRSSGATANNPFTLGGDGGVIQLGSSGLFALNGGSVLAWGTNITGQLGSGGIYDTKLARMVSGGAIASGSGGMSKPGPINELLNGPMNGSTNGGMNGIQSQLMEEEGIFYLFRHGQDGHSMIGGIPNSSGSLSAARSMPDNFIPDDGIPKAGIPSSGSIFNRVGLHGYETIGLHTESHQTGGHGFNATMYIADMGNTRNSEYGKGGSNNAFEIKDFSFGVENPTTIGSATGGAGGGKASFHEFTITKNIDSASPAFFKACCSGAHYKSVVIEMRKAGGDGTAKPYLKYTFSVVFVTKINWGGSGDDLPTETITFQYGVIGIQYQQEDKGSDKSSGLASKWNSSASSASPCLWCPY